MSRHASSQSSASPTLADPLQQVDRTFVRAGTGRLSYFGGCDYFRFGHHPEVLRGVRSGLDDFGLNVAASRSTTGNHRLFGELESAIARFFDAPSALLVASGYATNLVAAQGLAGDFTHALVDERSHPSVMDALTFLSCRVMTFRHRDVRDLAAKIRKLEKRSKPLLVTDGMFSHDGSAAPLADYDAILPRQGMMLVDDAHAAGVLGQKGRGAMEYAGIPRNRVIQTISLSKAFGVYGGAVICSSQIRDQMISRSRLFNGNTPLPLPLASAALVSVRLMRQAGAARRRMHDNAEWVKAQLRDIGWEIPSHPGPIVAIAPRRPREADALRRRLLLKRVFPSFIRYAAVPQGYFRFMISSEHTPEQLDALVSGLELRSSR